MRVTVAEAVSEGRKDGKTAHGKTAHGTGTDPCDERSVSVLESREREPADSPNYFATGVRFINACRL